MAGRDLSARDSVRKRAGNRCEVCGEVAPKNPGSKTRGTVHHRMPKRLGGGEELWNLILACWPCHKGIHDDEWEASLLGRLLFHSEPDAPLMHPLLGWVTLTACGLYTRAPLAATR